MILSGDVGGTKTNLALYEAGREGLSVRAFGSFPSREYASLETMLEAFLSGRAGGRPPVAAACLAVAGPVFAGRSHLTNLPWVVDARDVGRAAGAGGAWLLNDLQAAANAVPRLPPESFAVLQEGEAAMGGTVALIAAGTGLGQATLVASGGGYLPLASEGGHVDFAPRDALEIRLLTSLMKRFGRVSLERILSGPGIGNVHRFLTEEEGMEESPGVLARMEREDPARVISEEGLAGTSAACRRTLDLFVSILGAAAGNLALSALATGGVCLAGGIAPKILPALRGEGFLEAFRDKGRFRELASRLPVRVILDERAPLLGAAWHALERAGGAA